MNCSHDSQMLSAYLDNELAENLANEVDTRLIHCECCQRQMQRLRAVSRSLALPVVADPAFVVRLRESRERAAVWVWGWRRLALGLVPVTMGVLFAAGFVIWKSWSAPDNGAYAALEVFELGDGVALERADELAAEESVLRIAMEPFDLGPDTLIPSTNQRSGEPRGEPTP